LEFLKRKRERNVKIFISHNSFFYSHSQVLLAMATGEWLAEALLHLCRNNYQGKVKIKGTL
jgi:hypothetical protein